MMNDSSRGRSVPRASRRFVITPCVTGLLLVGCGATPTLEIDARTEPPVSAPAAPSFVEPTVAPMCDQVDKLQAILPEGVEPTGTNPQTTAEPIDDGSLPGDYDADVSEWMELGAAIETWAKRHAPDAYAGSWSDPDIGGYAIAFSEDVERHAENIRAQVHPGLAVAPAEYARVELEAIHDLINRDQLGRGDHGPGAVMGTGSGGLDNRVTLWVAEPGEERLAELSQTYGAGAICFEIVPAPQPPTDALTTLAKDDGWRTDDDLGSMSETLEIAYDRDTAERAWDENVGDLTPRDGELPAEPGIYGDLDDVDFDRQVLVVWTSGESGTCPAWMTDLDTVDGTIEVSGSALGGPFCTADNQPFRLLVAVDRDRLPDVADVASTRLGGHDGDVRLYPDSSRG